MRASKRGSDDSVVLAESGRLPLAGKRLLAALWLAVLLFTVGMIAAGWPRYWVYVAAETTPQAWLESVLLVLAAAVAALNAVVASLEKELAAPFGERGREAEVAGEAGQDAREAWMSAQAAPSVGRRGRGARQPADVRPGERGARLSAWIGRHGAWGWTITAAAFAWLALDERFALHERLRDRYLKRTGIRLAALDGSGRLAHPALRGMRVGGSMGAMASAWQGGRPRALFLSRVWSSPSARSRWTRSTSAAWARTASGCCRRSRNAWRRPR
ncbi:hypothetical protein [Cohnella rhizosphaerae]|uniref:Uncharacterized protein n=1 Tax=Cohnella rhizosphaerae TaxID=1457232 RepID=A0A9X4KSJ8_9BACL|nr:hypothetical protein [Cohnella rhizosphaerae]MDG0809753.1 hypothetical protein [Cohnella rhizosphaerae]